jgi:hypothetical protein
MKILEHSYNLLEVCIFVIMTRFLFTIKNYRILLLKDKYTLFIIIESIRTFINVHDFA